MLHNFRSKLPPFCENKMAKVGAAYTWEEFSQVCAPVPACLSFRLAGSGRPFSVWPVCVTGAQVQELRGNTAAPLRRPLME